MSVKWGCEVTGVTLRKNMTIKFEENNSMSQLKMTVDQTNKISKINKEIYGHFAEHLGRCIYGGIYVGKDSPIPNINGYRKDIVEALKAIKVPVLRWPGGCFADTYHWKDGIGSPEERRKIVNIHWGGVTEDNSFGTHEFLDFCELIGCDGGMTVDHYSNLYKQFQQYIPSNGKIACGPNAMDYNWTDGIMRNCQYSGMRGLSMHFYTIPTGDWSNKGSSVDFPEEEYYTTISNT